MDSSKNRRPLSTDNITLIADSGLFDLEFYLRQRAWLTAESPAAAIKDYLEDGWRSNADPGPGFSTEYYLAVNDDVACEGQNPLLHFLQYGRAEGRAPMSPARRRHDMIAVPPPFAPTAAEWEALSTSFAQPEKAVVDVVIPVFRGFDETLRCLFSVLSEKQETPFRAVVIDDCSPEPEITETLRRLAANGLIDLHRTPENLGFVRACNYAMMLHRDCDVVLLNSDTQVFGNWLDRLRGAALRYNRVATVTPFSNNAEICSYPRFTQENWRQLEVDDRTLDRLASIVNCGCYVELPTGVGFCIYVRRQCLDQIGLFDLANFPVGYGEENDLCRRAANAGWRNILAADVFVRHYGAVSFGETKIARVKRAMETMERLHSGYQELIAQFIREDPVRPMRESLDTARLANRAGKGAMLFITHTRGGGTEQHVQDMARLLEDSGIPVFFCRSSRSNLGDIQIEDPGSLDTVNLPNFVVARDLERFCRFLAASGIFHLHVHHLAGMPENTADFIRMAARASDLAYDVTLHDYMAVCPRINLVDRSGVYCGEPPLPVCEECIRRDGSPFGNPSVWEWRDRFKRFLSNARYVFVSDIDVLIRMRRFFPALNYVLRAHRNPFPVAPTSASREAAAKIRRVRRVALIGAIGNVKGSELLFEVARIAKLRQLPLEFVVVGYTDRDGDLKTLGNVEITGRYVETEAVDRLISAAPDLVWFPAVWPETFSYTLSAVLTAGLFSIAFDIGAVASRIRAANAGALWPMQAMLDPSRLAERLIEEPISQVRGQPDRPDYHNPLATYYDLHGAREQRV
jgi:GT2 family glycosyltransferase/glycosyltransferase involved in cell wall biosynthesis